MIIEELAAKLGLEVDGEAFAKGAEAIEGLKLGFEAVAGLAAAAGAALVAIVHTTAEAALEAQRAGQRLGMSADAYQELKFAADEANVPVEALESGMGHLSRTLAAASQGSHEMGWVVRQLGLRMYDAAGKARPTDEILGDVAEKLSQMPDGFRKTSLAQEAFGRGGKELIPLLNKGRAGIQELRDAAYDYGVVIDQDAIEAAERWEKQQKHLKAALLGVRNAIGAGLLKQVGDLTDKIADWIKVNRELIAGKVLAFIEQVKNVLAPLVTILDDVFVKTDAWKYSLGALLLVLFALNLPLLAIVGGLLAIQDLVYFFEGKQSLIGKILGSDEEREKVLHFMQQVKDFFTYLFGGGLGVDLAALLEGQGDFGSSIFGGLFKKGGGFADLLKSGAVSVAPTGPGILSQPPELPAGAVNSSSKSLTVQQTINAVPGMDPKDLADRSAQAVQDLWDLKMREGYGVVAE